MIEFIIAHWVEVFMSLVTAGSLAFCKYAYSKIQDYKYLLEQQDQQEAADLIKKEIIPILNKISDLEDNLESFKDKYNKELSIFIGQIHFQIIKKCKCYLEIGQLTTCQLEDLTELYQAYCSLQQGDVKEIDDYYERVKHLPVVVIK